MNNEGGERPVTAKNDVPLSILAFVCWLLGATLARRFGLWIGVGSVSILLGALILLTARGSEVRRLLRPTLVTLGIGAVAGLVMVIVTQVLFPFAVQWVPIIAPSTATLYGAFGTATSFKLAVMIAVIIGEEVVWRGLVQSAVAQKLGTRAAVVLAAAAYSVGHIPVGSPLLFLVALCCGLYWSALRAMTQSLVPSLISHILWDLTVLVWIPVLH